MLDIHSRTCIRWLATSNVSHSFGPKAMPRIEQNGAPNLRMTSVGHSSQPGYMGDTDTDMENAQKDVVEEAVFFKSPQEL